jgi:DNA-binding response OmpR family regulator
MDIMMPVMSGIEATLKIRESYNIPIIMVSAKGEDTDKIIGLNLGADDYIVKPFNPLELAARVKSALRRYTALGGGMQEEKDEVYTVDSLTVNNTQKQVYVDGESVRLTPIEYRILLLLIQNTGRVFSIDEIYEKVWNEPCINADNTVAVHIRRIREKIEIDPKNPRYVKVVWGLGYKIDKA